MKRTDTSLGRTEHELTMEYAGLILRDADLDDIAHYFVYIADDTAKALL